MLHLLNKFKNQDMISKKEAKHIADLARIGTDEKGIKKSSEDLSAILDWMEELK